MFDGNINEDRGVNYLVTKHDIEIRRYLAWRKAVRGKTIPIRLYEIIYVGLAMLWSKTGKPPLKTAIYKFVKRKEYKEELMSGQLFSKTDQRNQRNSLRRWNWILSFRF